MDRSGGTYDEFSQARRVTEPPKSGSRTAFERDRARVLHSSSLRRLAGKTQVVVPWTDDFVRNRLTHSLEVAQIGRELGKALGCDPELVETACLAHDLGHPPFGHNGEQALDEIAANIGGFEGNAQTLRVLARLEAKAFNSRGVSVGLNLTRATLDAATKYPWTRQPGMRKFGVYADDAETFQWLREGAPESRRCIEAQIMDWSDDVAYSVHDVEDGIVAEKIDLAALHDAAERDVLLQVSRTTYAPESEAAELGEALDRLMGLPFWPRRYDGSRRHLAALKDLTSQLIGRLAGAAERATRALHGGGPLTRYSADLSIPPETTREVAVLKGIAARFVMQTDERAVVMADQRAHLHELAQLIAERAPDSLSPAFRADWLAATDDSDRLRVVVDQIASLTDISAPARLRALQVLQVK